LVPLPPDCLERFRAIRLLGQGAYCTVWLTSQIGLDRPAAVKVLTPASSGEADLLARLTLEARITSTLKSPHIAVVYDHGALHGIPWIAFEYLDGPSLLSTLAHGPMAWRRAVQATSQVLAALEVAHARGVIHRDIKPSNVIESGPDRFKVIDFGLSRWRESREAVTRTGAVVGTPAYLAPEVIRVALASPASDIYSTGVLLYELLTGIPMFPPDTIPAMLERHLVLSPPPPSQRQPKLPLGLDAIVLRAVSKLPDDRFSSAQEMRRSLEELIKSETPSSLGSNRHPIRPRKAAVPAAAVRLPRSGGNTKRTRLMVWTCVSMISLTLGIGAAVVHRTRPTSASPISGPSAVAPVSTRPIRPAIAWLALGIGERRVGICLDTLEPEPVEIEVAVRQEGTRREFFRERCRMKHCFRKVVDNLAPSSRYVVEVRPIDPTVRFGSGVTRRAFSTWNRSKAQVIANAVQQLSSLSRPLALEWSPEHLTAMSELYGATDPELVPTLLQAAMSPMVTANNEFRWALFDAVEPIHDPRLLPAIRRLLTVAPLEQSRWGLIRNVGCSHEPEGIDLLIEQMRSRRFENDLEPEWAFAPSLARCDPARAAKFFEEVTRASGAWSELEQKTAAIGVGLFRRLDLVVPMVAMALRSKPAVTRAVIAVLGLLGNDESKNGLRRILASVQGGSPPGEGGRTTQEVVRALAVCAGPGDVDLLAELAGSRYPIRQRVEATMALGTVPGGGAVARLVALLGDAVPEVRRAAATALGRPDAVAAIEPLTARLGDTEASLGRVPRALGLIGDRQAVPALLEFVQRVRPRGGAGSVLDRLVVWDRAEALWALGRLKAPEALSLLEDGVCDPVSYVRLRSIEGLGLLGDPKALVLLERVSKRPDEKELVVRAANRATRILRSGRRNVGRGIVVDGAARVVRTGRSVEPGEAIDFDTQGVWLDREKPDDVPRVEPSIAAFAGFLRNREPSERAKTRVVSYDGGALFLGGASEADSRRCGFVVVSVDEPEK